MRGAKYTIMNYGIRRHHHKSSIYQVYGVVELQLITADSDNDYAFDCWENYQPEEAEDYIFAVLEREYERRFK